MLGKLFDNISFNSMSSKAFSKALQSAHQSNAYLEFSKRVHGTEFRQFNLLDKEQFEILIKRLDLDSTDKVLDLGCGLSELSVHLSNEYECEVTGLDFARDYLNSLNTPSRVSLIPADLNRIPHFENKFTKAVCLDSFYLLKNPSKVLNSIHSNLEEKGKFFLSYTQKTSKGILPGWLEHPGFEVEIMRFDKWNTEFWENWNQTLDEIQDQFIDEGNISLWKTKKREWDFQGPLLENNGLIRYLFILTKTA